jgi:hypothetical protein
LTKRLSYWFVLTSLFILAFKGSLQAQTDTTVNLVDTTPLKPVDTARLRPVDSVVATATPSVQGPIVDSTWFNHSPRKAAIRSAIIPGWGQAYNKQYWKIPIVYGALGTTGAVFVYNLKNYRELRLAYRGMIEATRGDSVNYKLMKPKYRQYEAESIKYYRDEFRKNIDYSVLVFVVFWGLNVADAAAAAHLRTFDVSSDLSLRIKPGRSYMGGTNGLSLILAFK